MWSFALPHPTVWWPLLGYQAAVLPLLLWAWVCWQQYKRARFRSARQLYRRRTGLLLILSALLSAALLHAPALLKLMRSTPV